MKYFLSLLLIMLASTAAGARITYQGSVESGIILCNEDCLTIFPLETIHGVNINPWLYAGIGGGMWVYWLGDGGDMAYPVYGNVRVSYPSRRFRPFADIRLGALIGSESFMAEPGVGIKFAWEKTAGIYLSAGTIFLAGSHHKGFVGLSLKLGFDF